MYNLCDYGHMLRIRELNEFISYILKNLPDEVTSAELIEDARNEIEWIEDMLEEKEEKEVEKICREMFCDNFDEYDN